VERSNGNAGPCGPCLRLLDGRQCFGRHIGYSPVEFVDVFPEQWVNLRWTRTPDGREYKGRVGYFIVYTTNRDTDGTECPAARMVVGEKPKTSFPPFRGGSFVGWPVHEGPVLSTCDGRIGVTPLAQAPDEVTREE
jgi:hypothetical protein